MDIKKDYKGEARKIVDSANLYENLKNLDSRREAKEHEKLFHKSDIPEHYTLCESSTPSALKIVETVSDPGTEISLTDVKAKVLDSDFHEYVEGEYVILVAEEKYKEISNYLPREEGYTRKQINDKIANVIAHGASRAEDILYDNTIDVSIDNVKTALDKLYSKVYYVAPEITSFVANPVGGVFEKGQTVSAPTFTWAYNKEVTTQSLTDCVLTDHTDRTATYGSNITDSKKFTLSASDGEKTVKKSISYTFVDPYYVGVSATDVIDESVLTALTKKVEVKETKTVPYTTSQSYMVFAYPSAYGTLTSILDQNGFNITDSFVMSNVTVNTISYNVYVSNKCSGSYSIKFNV